MHGRIGRISFVAAVIAAIALAPVTSTAQDAARWSDPDGTMMVRLHALAPALARLAETSPGVVAIAVGDLQSGRAIAVNGGQNLPAASTIKIAVMVEVFRQIAEGRYTLSRKVTLLDQDRDDGYGSLCDAPRGSRFSVVYLLARMIDYSDNTATNMLIRLAGRYHINRTMASLGLEQTRLGDVIHSDGDIRALRTSANDMLRLLTLIASGQAVDRRSSALMLRILARQRHNTLLPQPLPKTLTIAHKTGTLHDTLNDVGVVELNGAPYVICVLTTHLSDLDDGERVIRAASLLTFQSFRTAARSRELFLARNKR